MKTKTTKNIKRGPKSKTQDPKLVCFLIEGKLKKKLEKVCKKKDISMSSFVRDEITTILNGL